MVLSFRTCVSMWLSGLMTLLILSLFGCVLVATWNIRSALRTVGRMANALMLTRASMALRRTNVWSLGTCSVQSRLMGYLLL